jgi:hypothetical protein
MKEHAHIYFGPAGIMFTDDELRELSRIMDNQPSPLRDALRQRINAYLMYLDATRRIQDGRD